MTKKIFLADLSHTSASSGSVTFPLGAAFVTSYAQKVLAQDSFEFKLFKFPEPMARAIVAERPSVLAFSNYQWNLELTYKLCEWAKAKFRDIVIVFGGPNFPVARGEKIEFFHRRPVVDFNIEFEGELAFASLISKLSEHAFDAEALKTRHERIVNCSYLHGGELIEGPSERIGDVNVVPSPYLTGILDPFFDMRLIPMIETTRGCPFTCAFCADGMAIKSRIVRVDKSRTQAELSYIAERIKDVHELIITDLNFGMYDQDADIAEYIDEIKQRHDWPRSIQAAAGKNKQEKVLKVADLLKGTWVTGSAIQSSDPEVLKNVKRSNISLDAYKQFTQYANSLNNDSSSYTEIILGLPGDTKEKHFQTLRYSIESGVKKLYIYQAILLAGTEMAAPQTRERFGLRTKFRIIAGGWGTYDFAGEQVAAVEIEEIVVGSTTMSAEDYVSCRVMDLLVDFFYNNALCEELCCALTSMGVSAFDVLLFLHEHEELHSPVMREVLGSFRFHTTHDLHDSHEAAARLVSECLAGELGSKDLSNHKARLYAEFGDVLRVFVDAVKALLAERGMLNDVAADYFEQAMEFILCRKRAIQDVERVEEKAFSYDFEAIDKIGYAIDPRTIVPAPEPLRFRFAHTAAQKETIRMALGIYGSHTGGVTRAFKRLNLRKVTRQFAPAS